MSRPGYGHPLKMYPLAAASDMFRRKEANFWFPIRLKTFHCRYLSYIVSIYKFKMNTT